MLLTCCFFGINSFSDYLINFWCVEWRKCVWGMKKNEKIVQREKFKEEKFISPCKWMCESVKSFFGKEKILEKFFEKEKSLVANIIIIIIKKKVHKSVRRRKAVFLQMYMLRKAV